MMITTHLASGIFSAVVGDDLVFLDVGADAYHCLADAAACVVLGDRTLSGPVALVAVLRAGGLVTDRAEPYRVTPLPPIVERRTGLEDGDAGSMAGFAHLWGAERRARRSLCGLPLAEVLALPGEAGPADPDPKHIAQLTSLFARWLPWVPVQGACLYRAVFLRTLLRRAGQDATWVFGVRTWPFAAHCWLQAGDVVLDDGVDRVRSFTPIMAA